MSSWTQTFYLSGSSGATAELSPVTHGDTCMRNVSLPPHLSAQHIAVTTTSATPPSDFWTASGSCAQFEFIVRRKS